MTLSLGCSGCFLPDAETTGNGEESFLCLLPFHEPWYVTMHVFVAAWCIHAGGVGSNPPLAMEVHREMAKDISHTSKPSIRVGLKSEKEGCLLGHGFPVCPGFQLQR